MIYFLRILGCTHYANLMMMMMMMMMPASGETSSTPTMWSSSNQTTPSWMTPAFLEALATHDTNRIGEGVSKVVYQIPHTTQVFSILKQDPQATAVVPIPVANSFITIPEVIHKLHEADLLVPTTRVGAYSVSPKCDCVNQKDMQQSVAQLYTGTVSPADEKKIVAKYQDSGRMVSGFADDLIAKNILGMDLHIFNVCTTTGADAAATTKAIAVDSDGMFEVDLERPVLYVKDTIDIGGVIRLKVASPEALFRQIASTTPIALVREHILQLHPQLTDDAIRNSFSTYVHDLTDYVASGSIPVNDARLRVFVSQYVYHTHLTGGLLTLRKRKVYHNATPRMQHIVDSLLGTLYGHNIYTSDEPIRNWLKFNVAFAQVARTRAIYALVTCTFCVFVVTTIATYVVLSRVYRLNSE